MNDEDDKTTPEKSDAVEASTTYPSQVALDGATGSAVHETIAVEESIITACASVTALASVDAILPAS